MWGKSQECEMTTLVIERVQSTNGTGYAMLINCENCSISLLSFSTIIHRTKYRRSEIYVILPT